MADALNFDSNGIPPRTSPDPVPNGWYRAMVVESAIKDTNDKKGKYLQLDWQILDGEHKGRIIWDRLNVQNANPTAQKIAHESLSAICHETGVLKLTHSSQLHNIPLLIKLVVKQRDKNYDPSNEVKGYKRIEGAGAPAATPGAAAPSSTAVPAAAAPAWAQKKAS